MKRRTRTPVAPATLAACALSLVASPGVATADTKEESPPFKLGGYAEAFYQWNTNQPSNGLTNARGFDNHDNTFTLSNVALGAKWDTHDVLGELTLQVGHTPSTYYLGEPAHGGTASANASDGSLWKFVQQAYVGYRFGVGRGLTVTAGIFLPPIGPEAMAVRDSWNWSRSNLFFALPFYYSAVRASYPLTKRWTVTASVSNGWNSVVDENKEKSISAELGYAGAKVAAAVLYLGGVERRTGALEGRAFRHLFDAHATWTASSWLSFAAQANGGFERNLFGVSHWEGGALYARIAVTPTFAVAVRGDALAEHRAENSRGRADGLFFGVPWVSSRTATLDYHPDAHVSFRMEVRHDDAAENLFFGGAVHGNGADVPFVPNRRAQNTLTLGVTGGF